MDFDFKAAKIAIDASDKAESDLEAALAAADIAFSTAMDHVCKASASKISIKVFADKTGLSHGRVQRLYSTALVVRKFQVESGELRGVDKAVQSFIRANSKDEMRLVLSESKTLAAFMSALRKPKPKAGATDKAAEDLVKSAVSALTKALDAAVTDADLFGEQVNNLHRVMAALRAEHLATDAPAEDDGPGFTEEEAAEAPATEAAEATEEGGE